MSYRRLHKLTYRLSGGFPLSPPDCSRRLLGVRWQIVTDLQYSDVLIYGVSHAVASCLRMLQQLLLEHQASLASSIGDLPCARTTVYSHQHEDCGEIHPLDTARDGMLVAGHDTSRL
jgi:hypothetical protein